MSLATTTLGSKGPSVPAIGVGLMSLGHAYGHAGDDAERLKYLDSLYEMGETFWDDADIYGDSEELVGKWFTANPEKRKDIFLSTKFAICGTFPDISLRSDPEYAKEAVEKSLGKLKTDYIDLYYCHRPDGKTPIEQTVRAMAEMKEQGKIKHIGLSEVTARDLRRACQVTKIDAVQSEFSPWALDPETLGVLDVCREFGVALVAYSPLGRGFLTGQIRSPDDVEGSRKMFPRFSPENFQKNFEVVEKLEKIAEKKGVKAGQLGLAWLMKQGKGTTVLPIFGTRTIARVKENLGALDVQLTAEEEKEIREVVQQAEGVEYGGRYPAGMEDWQNRDTPEEK